MKLNMLFCSATDDVIEDFFAITCILALLIWCFGAFLALEDSLALLLYTMTYLVLWSFSNPVLVFLSFIN